MGENAVGASSPRTPEANIKPALTGSPPSKSNSATPSGEKKPKSLWETWKGLSVSEKIGWGLFAIPALPLVVALGPLIALQLSLEKDNAVFYEGAYPRASEHVTSPPPSPLARRRTLRGTTLLVFWLTCFC